jgi:6-methylsalicylate decarboxylase
MLTASYCQRTVGEAYLGDPLFDPLLAELNLRNAVVFVHPSELESNKVADLPPYVADFLLDTVRAAVKLARAGALDRFPNIKFILPNAGGLFAICRLAPVGRRLATWVCDDGLRLLRKYYFETSLSSTKFSLHSLLAFADPGRILFGTDFPYAPLVVGNLFTAELDGLEPDNLVAINRDNAKSIFQRVRRAAA